MVLLEFLRDAMDADEVNASDTFFNSSLSHDNIRPAQHGSPVPALLICVPLLVLLFRYRQAFASLTLRWSRNLPLRRHLGGRGHYVSVSQSEG